MIYLIILVLFILAILLQNKIGKKRSIKIAFVISFFVIFLFLSLRSISVGLDTSNYIYFFVNYGRYSWKAIFSLENEWGFAILCKIIYLIWPNQQFFLAVVGLLCTLPICITYSKNIQEAPIVSMLIFLSMSVFSMMFSGLRQAIAIAIVCMAYKPLIERQFIRYFLLVFIASMFHASAIVAILFYFVYSIRMSQKSFIFAFAFIGIITIFNKQIMDSIIKFMTLINVKYANYEIKETNAFRAALVYMVILLIFYLFNPVFDKNNQYFLDNIDKEYSTVKIKNGIIYDKKINIMFMLILIQTFASNNIGPARIAMYIVSWLPIIISEYFDSYKFIDDEKDKIIFKFGFFIVFTYQFINDIVINGGLGLLPYIPFWR